MPENNLPMLSELIQKRLQIKVNENLSKFKLDIQTLRKGVKFLREEQTQLRETPIHAIFTCLHYVFYGFLVLLFMTMVDIFTSDFIDGTLEQFNKHKGLPVFFIKLFLKLLILSNTFCEKFFIHRFNFYVFIFCLLVIPSLAYFIKFFIPKRYTLYSTSTIEQLCRYEY